MTLKKTPARRTAAKLPHKVTVLQMPMSGVWTSVCQSCGWDSGPAATREAAANEGHAHEIIHLLRK